MNRRILCVDDEEAILKALHLHVRKVFEMSTANSGSEGLEVFEKEGPFSVVTAEMRMPGMDGATFLAKVKELDLCVSTVLLTVDADFEFGERPPCRQAKCSAFSRNPALPYYSRKPSRMGLRRIMLPRPKRNALTRLFWCGRRESNPPWSLRP